MTTESDILDTPDAPSRDIGTSREEVRHSGRFALVFLVMFVAVWASAVAIHFIGNPDGLFPSLRNPSSREMAWKQRQFARMVEQGKPPTMLVLGSSRMMQTSTSQLVRIFPGSRPFNFATPGASPLDMLAGLRYALSVGAKPTRILIGVDDQAMFGRYDSTHAVRILQSRELFAKLPLRERIRVALRAPGQIKPDLTWQALRNTISPPPRTRRRVQTANTVIMGDGYIVYPRRELGRRDGSYDLRAELDKKLFVRRALGEEGKLYPDTPLEVSARQWKYLRALLSLCKREGIEATVVFTPSMPDANPIMMRPTEVAARGELSARLRTLCRREGAAYRDLSDINSFAGDPKEFWDEFHPTGLNMRRMVNVAFGRKPDDGEGSVPTDLDRILNPTPTNSATTR